MHRNIDAGIGRRGEFGAMSRQIPTERQAMRRLRHWGMELAIVAGGVLLALWAQAWFEGRKEARIHGDTIAQMDALFGRALAQTAARVSSSECARSRIAELDDALRTSTGQWKAMPLGRAPDRLNVGHYPVVYLVDSDVLPLQIFDTARQNGTLATLAPGDLEFYERLERELNWLNDVWVGSGDALMRLSVLGLDGPLGERARDELRQALAWLDGENRVTVLRAGALARLAQERGVRLGPDDLAAYRGKVERDRQLFGDCVVEVDPLDLKPVTARTPEVEQ
jgi:hypothetical protein